MNDPLENKSETIKFRVKPSLKSGLEAVARARDIPVSRILEDFVKETITEHEKREIK